MIGVDRSRENLSGIGLALKKEIIIKDLLIPPQEEVIQLILRHDFLVGKDFTIECAVWKRKSVCPHTGVATWSECVIVRECITVTDVPRGSVKHVRFSQEAAIQDLRERAEKILAIRESEELAEEAVRLGRMVSSDAPLY